MTEKHLSLADRWMQRFETENPEIASEISRKRLVHQRNQINTVTCDTTAGQSKTTGSACLWTEPPPAEIPCLDPAVISAIKTRETLKLTQVAFARCLGISERTLRDWEQGRRRPSGAALTLLSWASRNPKLVLDLK